MAGNIQILTETYSTVIKTISLLPFRVFVYSPTKTVQHNVPPAAAQSLFGHAARGQYPLGMEKKRDGAKRMALRHNGLLPPTLHRKCTLRSARPVYPMQAKLELRRPAQVQGLA